MRSWYCMFLLVLGLTFFAAPCSAQSGFTYQGLITGPAGPASGPLDLRFRLFTAASAGSQLGSQVTIANVPLDEGRFTVALDFGVSPFVSSSVRWLEINVVQAGVTTPLLPRQPLTATPLAISTRGLFVDTTGRLGVLTSTPEYGLDVRGSFRTAGPTQPDASNTIAPATRASGTFWQSFTPLITGELRSVTVRATSTANWAGTLQIFAGEGTAGAALTGLLPVADTTGTSKDVTVAIPNGVNVAAGVRVTFACTLPDTVGLALAFNNPYLGGTNSSGASTDLYFLTSVSPIGLVVTESGRTGVGTTAPSVALDVRGDIKLAPAGNLFAASGEENLRLLRGSVDVSGLSTTTITAGSGFSAFVLGQSLRITFTNPYPSTPTVIASTTNGLVAQVESVSGTNFTVRAVDSFGNNIVFGTWNFVVMGPR